MRQPSGGIVRAGALVLALGAIACSSSEPGHSAAPVSASATAWRDTSAHRASMIAVAPDVRLEVLDWGGTGLPLVFLSGLQDVAHGFDDFAPQFTGSNRVIAITRRGYGASSQPPTGYDVTTRVADLHAVLDSLHLARVVLIGHSIAGDELTAFAGRYPDRVAGLVYLDAAYDHSTVADLLKNSPPPPVPMLPADSASPAAVQAWTLRAWGMRIPETQLRAIGRYDSTGKLVANVTPDSIDAAMLAGAGHPDYTRVRAPVLAIYAIIDSMPNVFPAWQQFDSTSLASARRFTRILQDFGVKGRAAFRKALPSARVVELHGANHYVFYSNEPEVREAIGAFVSHLR